MLSRTVHFPQAYRALPSDDAAKHLFCQQALLVLTEAVSSCVILMDRDGRLRAGLMNAVRSFPPKYAPRAVALLKALERSNRLVEVNDAYNNDPRCHTDGCASACGIAGISGPDAVIVPTSCVCQGACDALSGRLAIDDYVGSTFFDRRSAAISLELADNNWSKQDFEDRVLVPIFRYAKRVSLIDRQIGASTCGTNATQPAVKPGYANTLKWIYDSFIACSDHTRPRRFDVYCSIDDRTDEWVGKTGAIKDTVEVLRRFAESVSDPTVPLDLHVKLDRATARMPHDRFLITNQFAVTIGRGFDILKPNDRIRDVILKPILEGPGILRAVQDLVDAD